MNGSTRKQDAAMATDTLGRVTGIVRLTVEGRKCTTAVTEVPEQYPVLIGQILLELSDSVVECEISD
jgi:hypothetical protein